LLTALTVALLNFWNIKKEPFRWRRTAADRAESLATETIGGEMRRSTYELRAPRDSSAAIGIPGIYRADGARLAGNCAQTRWSEWHAIDATMTSPRPSKWRSTDVQTDDAVAQRGQSEGNNAAMTGGWWDVPETSETFSLLIRTGWQSARS
jgi:hypothetical protein